MPITVPNRARVKVAYDKFFSLPAAAGETIPDGSSVFLTTNIHETGLNKVTKTGTRGSYLGFVVVGAPAGEAVGAMRQALITGFSGLTAGAEVYIDNTNTANFTHTATNNGAPVGIAYSTDTILFY